MIAQFEEKDVQVSGNFPKKAFTINADAKAFSILSDRLYTNKVKAVIREISCNAFDSHVEAGNPAPFDVHLPTYLESWFSVRDYGTGISPEQIVSLYTELFTSTRTKSNDFVGNLGLGRVSVFSICDSFTVISFFDSTKSTYSVYKDSSGIPNVALLTQELTYEPNGLLVSVTVPSNQKYEFEQEAVKVFQYFDKQPNINVDSVKNLISDKQKYTIQTDEFCLTGNYGSLYAVMGNVSYQIDSSLNPNNLEGFIRFNIGDLDFDPGREKLSLDKRTKENVQAKVGNINNYLCDILLKQIEAEPTDFTKMLKYYQLNDGHLGFCLKANAKLFSKYILHNVKVQFKHLERSAGRVLETLRFKLPTHNVKYYLRQDGYTTRAKNYVRDTGMPICLLSQENIDELKIDANLINDLSALPKIVRGPSNKAPTEGIAVLGDRYGKLSSLPDGEKVYVEVCRDEPVNSKYGAFGRLHTLSSNIKLLKHINMPTIYMVKTAITKKKTFTDDKWIRLDDYVAREYAKVKKGGFIKYDGQYEDFFNLIHDSVQVWPSDHPLVTFVEKSRLRLKASVCHVLKEVGYYDDSIVDTTMEDLETKMFEEFPMLAVIDNTDYYKYKTITRPEQKKWDVIIEYMLTRKESCATI